MGKEYGEFKSQCDEEISAQAESSSFRLATNEWLLQANQLRYSYHFEWLGRPIIQYPQDVVAFQELVWAVQPDLIIETGIAHGGSLILSASLLSLLDYCDATRAGHLLDTKNPRRLVVGIDIDIREHNRIAIESHPMANRIKMLEGSSIDPEIVAEVRRTASEFNRILICLDSNHTHDHVFAELEAYGPLVSEGSYCVVFDTIIEDLPANVFPDRPWGPGNSPKTAVSHWLEKNPGFEIDTSIENKLMISVAPKGFIKRAS